MARKVWLVVACFAALTIASNTAQAGGHVYALRGLINVFSRGMDTMVDKCKMRGIPASAHGYGEYPTLAIEAAKLAKSGKGPIVIIGHSLGADAAVYMANEMKKLGAPVALLVLYGPTIDLEIPSNVRSVVNYYQSSSALWRGKATKGSGFAGSINNVNLDKAEDVTHFNIEKVDRLQNQAMGRIAALTGTGRPIPTDTAPPTVSGDPMANPNPVAAPPNRPSASTGRTTAGAAPTAPPRAAGAPKRARSPSRPSVDTPAQHGTF